MAEKPAKKGGPGVGINLKLMKLAQAAKGLTNAELANRIDCDVRTIERTRQRGTIAVDLVPHLAWAIDVEPESLLRPETADLPSVSTLPSSSTIASEVAPPPWLPGILRVETRGDLGAPRPDRFFIGYQPTWADLRAEVDVRRSVVVDDERIDYAECLSRLRAATGPPLSLFYGEGGAGKTTLLKRLMYDLAEAGEEVFYVLDHQPFQAAEIVAEARKEPRRSFFVFVDEGQNRAPVLLTLAEELNELSARVRVVAAARRNEWNVRLRGQNWARAPHSEFNLPVLSDDEIRGLLDRLAAHHSLGRLELISPAERVDKLSVRARRQLLVGLLEATQGKGFREIVQSELDNIGDGTAKELYFAVCLLASYGLSMPFDAGLLSTGLPSQLEFERTILPALDLLIRVESRDNCAALVPRHRLVAEEVTGSRDADAHPERLLSHTWDLLRRWSQGRRGCRSAQRTAGRLVQELRRRRYFTTEEQADATVDLLLTAGSPNFRLNDVSHLARIRRDARRLPVDVPHEMQFRVAAQLLSPWSGDEALRVLQSGLAINDDWNYLHLETAILQFRRGNLAAAEESVQRILRHNKIKRPGELSLPIRLAVELAQLKRDADPTIALSYLELVRFRNPDEVRDDSGYFLLRADLHDRLDDHVAALTTLRRGFDCVRKPKKMVRALEAAYFRRFAKDDPAGFLAWARRTFPRPEVDGGRGVQEGTDLALRVRLPALIRHLAGYFPAVDEFLERIPAETLQKYGWKTLHFLQLVLAVKLNSSVGTVAEAAVALLAKLVLGRNRFGALYVKAMFNDPDRLLELLTAHLARLQDPESSSWADSILGSAELRLTSRSALQTAVESAITTHDGITFKQLVGQYGRKDVFSVVTGNYLKTVGLSHALGMIVAATGWRVTGLSASARKFVAASLVGCIVRGETAEFHEILSFLKKPGEYADEIFLSFLELEDLPALEYFVGFFPDRTQIDARRLLESLRRAVHEGKRVSLRHLVRFGLINTTGLLPSYLSVFRAEPTEVFEQADRLLKWEMPIPNEIAAVRLRTALAKRNRSAALETCRRAWDYRKIVHRVLQEKLPAEEEALLRAVLQETNYANEDEKQFDTADFANRDVQLLRYQAAGRVRGLLEVPAGGEGASLTLADGIKFRAQVPPPVLAQLGPLPLRMAKVWLIYPRTEEAELVFQIGDSATPRSTNLDRFTVSGEVVRCFPDAGQALIRVRSNLPFFTDSRPIEVPVHSDIPSAYVGWFVVFDAERRGQVLLARQYRPVIRLRTSEQVEPS